MQFQEFIDMLNNDTICAPYDEPINKKKYDKIISSNSRNWGIKKSIIAYDCLNYMPSLIMSRLDRLTNEDKEFVRNQNAIKFLLSHPTPDFLCNYVFRDKTFINNDKAILNYIKKNPFNKYIQTKYINKFTNYCKFALEESYGEYFEYENTKFCLLKIKGGILELELIIDNEHNFKYENLLKIIKILNGESDGDVNSYCKNCYLINKNCICKKYGNPIYTAPENYISQSQNGWGSNSERFFFW